MSSTIPSPSGLPFIGNAWDVDPSEQVASLSHLADIYGPIYKLRIGGRDIVIISNHELYDELCDEKRFTKAVTVPLTEVRHALHDGLFTASYGAENWGIAHRILVPAFGPFAMHDMFDEMLEIASQLVLKWARFGSRTAINVTDDFTRLTLDSIALCAMEARFNSFYREEMHPFPQAMTRFLSEAGKRALRPAIVNSMMWSASKRFEEDIALMQRTAMDIVNEKRAHPSNKKTLLSAMLDGKDPKTGKKMSEASIADNMVTFLIAGHETTSGLLSYVFYYLCTRPEVQRKAQKEVDEVVGCQPVQAAHMSKLPYIVAIMRETLRLNPPAAQPAVEAKPDNPDEMIVLQGGKYVLPKNAAFRLLTRKIQIDPSVYGEDAGGFKPERMLDEKFSQLPKNAWKPFGNGERACIGRPFAWQESILAIALLLQTFNFCLDDPAYRLQTKQTLTIKPVGFLMRAELRHGLNTRSIEQRLTGAGTVVKSDELRGGSPRRAATDTHKSQLDMLSIFWGGNAGTCESLARTLEKSAMSHGYQAEVKVLDDAVGKIPKDQPTIFITSTYEGQPPDNAKHFLNNLEGLKEADLEGVSYAVFGCGNHEWQATYQKIPTLFDELMEKSGATRIAVRGLADAAASDMFTDFEEWEEHAFWPAMQNLHGSKETVSREDDFYLDAEIMTTTRASHLKQTVHEARIVKNSQIESSTSQRWHLETELPSDLSYKAGDYLAVLPLNHASTIHRVMTRFRLPWDAVIRVNTTSTTLPHGAPVSVYDVLKAYVELNQPATVRNIKKLAAAAVDEKEKSALEEIASTSSFTSEITAKHVSVLDLLERYPSISIPFQVYLAMLPQLRLRQYSISSSPLANPQTCTLTYNKLDTTHLSGVGRFLGAASNYLAALQPGDIFHVIVKESHVAFHLPLDIENTPLIMVAAGTGIAPFRGFVQERACQAKAGRKLAPALLFLGCRTPDDVPHSQELADWVAAGTVDLRLACSQDPTKSNGARYVQERMRNDIADVRRLFDNGAKIYICGSGRVANGVKDTVINSWMERHPQKSREEADDWFTGLRNERFTSDIFD